MKVGFDLLQSIQPANDLFPFPFQIGSFHAALELLLEQQQLSPEATDDLQEIWVYIANDNPAAADKLEEDIYAACELLVKNPRLGHRRSDLTDEPVLF